MQLLSCRNYLPCQWFQIKIVEFFIPLRAKCQNTVSHYWSYNLCIYCFWPLGVLLPAVKYNLHVVLCRIDTVHSWSAFPLIWIAMWESYSADLYFLSQKFCFTHLWGFPQLFPEAQQVLHIKEKVQRHRKQVQGWNVYTAFSKFLQTVFKLMAQHENLADLKLFVCFSIGIIWIHISFKECYGTH